jgi:DNA mismatch repair protein MutL
MEKRYKADTPAYAFPAAPEKHASDTPPAPPEEFASFPGAPENYDLPAPPKLLPEEFTYTVIGVLFAAFIAVERGDAVYFIDQHAAHERILFDKFMAEESGKPAAVQDLLIPYLLSVNAEEYDCLQKIAPELASIGVAAEPFGDSTFKISTVPASLTGMNLDVFFEEVLENLGALKAAGMPGVLRESLIKKACKSAVKAGDALSGEALKYIVGKIFGGAVLLCPHGRPVSVKYTKREFEKLFKRIV